MLYKNWPEICKLSSTNRLLMMGLATLDLNNSESSQITSCLTRFFVRHEVQGHVPLSILKHEESVMCDVPTVYYISEVVANKFNVPTLSFGEKGKDGPIPLELEGHWDSMEDIVEWKGHKFLVLMDQDIAGTLILAPAECVDLNA